MEGAGYGLFAGRHFKAKQCIGLYHGRAYDASNPPPVTDHRRLYRLESKLLKKIIDAEGGVAEGSHSGCPLYFGIHMANDASKCEKKGKGPKLKSDIAKYQECNIVVDSRCWAYALTDIKKGQELFLKYNDEKERQPESLATRLDPKT